MSRSHVAMDSKTVLVGELMLGLVIVMVKRKKNEQKLLNLLKTMMMTLLEKKVMHMKEAIDKLNNMKRAHQ